MSSDHFSPHPQSKRPHTNCRLFSHLSDHHLLQLEASGAVRTYALDRDERVEFYSRHHDEVVYLLSGAVTVDAAGDTEVVNAASGGCHPIPLPTRSRVTLRANQSAWLCRTDRSHLDYVLGWTSLAAMPRHGNDDFQTFLERLRNPAVFRYLPLHNVEQAFEQMSHRQVKAGDIIMNQGDTADNFYIIESGEAEVWEQGLYDDEQQKVSVLGAGDHFGGDALVSGGTRGATVRMVSEGTLLVLAGEQFKALIQQPMVHEVDPKVARVMMDSGERKLIDVRYEEEWEERHLRGVMLMPLFELRRRLSELDPEQQYITCCRSGKRSAVAAMILSEAGIDTLSLRGGINAWPYETESST